MGRSPPSTWPSSGRPSKSLRRLRTAPGWPSLPSSTESFNSPTCPNDQCFERTLKYSSSCSHRPIWPLFRFHLSNTFSSPSIEKTHKKIKKKKILWKKKKKKKKKK